MSTEESKGALRGNPGGVDLDAVLEATANVCDHGVVIKPSTLREWAAEVRALRSSPPGDGKEVPPKTAGAVAPGEPPYRLLLPGEKTLATDEYERNSGDWKILSDSAWVVGDKYDPDDNHAKMRRRLDASPQAASEPPRSEAKGPTPSPSPKKEGEA